jgi:hypothetical protein
MPKSLKTEKKVRAQYLSKSKRNAFPEKSTDIKKEESDQESKMLSSVEKNYRQILEMQDKILAAPAMNGGFTTLLFKVENIEKSQEKLVEKVDEIHNVLYEPDNGIYARIKAVENDKIGEDVIDDIQKEVHEIKVWKSSEEKLSEKEEIHLNDNDKLLVEHDNIIKDIQKSISRYNTAIKWISVSVGGGLLSTIGKLIYDYISGHMKIV